MSGGTGPPTVVPTNSILMYATPAVATRINPEVLNPIALAGLSINGAVQPVVTVGPQVLNPMAVTYGQVNPMVQPRAPVPQPHFISVGGSRGRVPHPILPREEKMDEEETPSDNSAAAIGIDVGAADMSAAAGSQSEQRLKVEDALNYLDQVKYKFGNQPQVYNDFLDIMKEFKSQSIDTPGVIARVSHLFRGHPELIIGFNTFLPPGYKIEIQANDSVSLSMVGQGGGYVVTTVQPGPSGHPPCQTAVMHQHPSAPITPSRAPLANVTSNSGRVSPQQPPLVSAVTSTPSAFTHSYSSPFVQSAFPTMKTQPVEFKNAIKYVNKIKNRFQEHPEKYKQFLEILHTYASKDQRNVSTKQLTEQEVYSQVVKLFENQDDLLHEFWHFLPSATATQAAPAVEETKKNTKPSREYGTGQPKTGAPKRPSIQPATASQERKKAKESQLVPNFQLGREITLLEMGRYGTLTEFSFFDKVRDMLKSPVVYKNFLRCLMLYNNDVIALNELLILVDPFLSKAPELHQWFKDFVGMKQDAVPCYYDVAHVSTSKSTEKLTEEQLVEIDFSTCKRLGASYCAMPKNSLFPKCSGRNLLPLCKEVLNDVWVSFPAWSEDTTFSNSRKTSFEECIYRIEDERFELDVVIETNASVMRLLESGLKKMTRIAPDELTEFELDDCLGGSSSPIHQRAIRRIYGEKSSDIIDGLRKHPHVAIPLVIRRLKMKEEEWREAQKQFNKTWREQTEKFYLKSLDLQGISFKQADVRALRSKALLNEIESIYDEQQDQILANTAASTPHLTFLYKGRQVLDDACLLLLHHVRRQTSIHKDDKRKIKQILKHLVADFFHHTRMELSDDEDETRIREYLSPDEQDGRSPTDYNSGTTRRRNGNNKRTNLTTKAAAIKKEKDTDYESINSPGPAKDLDDNAIPSTSASANTFSDVLKQKRLPTIPDSQESRRTIAKRELKLLLSEVASHKLTDVGRTSLRDKANKEYLRGASKDDTNGGSMASISGAGKRRMTRRNSLIASQSLPAAETTETNHTPRNLTVPCPDQDEAYTLFYANSNWYVFLRLHQILCERMYKLYERAEILLLDETREGQQLSAAKALRLRPSIGVEVEYYYPHFLEMIRNLLDGNMESNLYEDTLREMFGIHAYIAYSMDKVVSNAVRQLQSIMSDEVSQKCLELYYQAVRRGASGGFFATMCSRATQEAWYQKQAERLCEEETCVKVYIFKKYCRMTMELLECETGDNMDIDQKAKYSAYVANFLKADSTIPESIVPLLCVNPVFLPRNIRKWKKKNLLEWISDNAKRNKGSLTKVSNVQRKAVEIPGVPEVMIKSEPLSDEEMDAKVIGESTNEKIGKLFMLPSLTPKSDPDFVDDSEHLVMKTIEPSHTERTVEYVMHESLKCQFNLSSYRMVYLTNSEDLIYLQGAMQRARKNHKRLALDMFDKFMRWHKTWRVENAPPTLATQCHDFFMDKNNSGSRRTRKVTITKLETPPYRKYHRYLHNN